MFNTTSKNERKNYNIINQNRKNCKGTIELQIGEKVYNIERKSEKYVKRLKGVETNEARTFLDFTQDEDLSLNGTTRNETDANIRKQFGTIEDFLLTSMASQLDSLSFIKEGSTKRKEILAKFLDLEIFENKFKLAKDDSSDLKAVIRRIGDVNYDNDIALAEVLRDEAQKKLEVDKATCSMLRSRVGTYEETYKNLSDQIDSIPTERLNIKKLLERKTQLSNNVDSTKENISELKQEIVDFDQKLQSYDDFLTTINIEELLEEKKQYDIFKRRYDDTINRARIMDNDYKGMSKKLTLLDEVPCGSSYVSSCKFIADAHNASVEMPVLEKTIIEKIEEAKDYKEKIVTVDSAAMVALIDSYNETIIAKNGIEIEKRDNKVSIEKLFAKIKTMTGELEETNNKISLYEDNKEAIQNIENLISSREETRKKIKKTENEISDFEGTLSTHNRTIGSLEQKVEDLLEKKQDLIDIRAEFAAYDLFMRCMHSNGIAYDIIKRRLPVINEEIAKTISNIVDFEVFFQEDGNKLDVLIKHPNYEARPIEMGSGAEKTLASMGIRLALLSVSSLPKGNIFILDEPGTALDAENMEGFVRMLDLVKTYFKTVILISHLDSLKDIVDMEITIDKKDGYALISQ